MFLKPSKLLSYWIGVVQTDGSLENYKSKEDKISTNIHFGICKNSLPMLQKFHFISKNLLKRDSKIFSSKSRPGVWEYHIGIRRLLNDFKNLDIMFGDPPIPPFWVTENPEFLGAYLAGIIDGDGDIRIKRKTYPQCAIRISSGKPQEILSNIIKQNLGCSVSLFSSKNMDFINKFVIPEIALSWKREKLIKFSEYILAR
jgi:hypothetical protein